MEKQIQANVKQPIPQLYDVAIDIERLIDLTCKNFGVARSDFAHCRRWDAFEARREVAQKLVEVHPDWTIESIGEYIGLKANSSRLGRGVFNFWTKGGGEC